VYEMATIQPIGSSALVNERIGDLPFVECRGESMGKITCPRRAFFVQVKLRTRPYALWPGQLSCGNWKGANHLAPSLAFDLCHPLIPCDARRSCRSPSGLGCRPGRGMVCRLGRGFEGQFDQ